MPPMKARVHKGRLHLDEATDLPEGSEIELVPADWWDDLDDDSRRRLEEALAQSERDMVVGRLIPAGTVMRKLRQKA